MPLVWFLSNDKEFVPRVSNIPLIRNSAEARSIDTLGTTIGTRFPPPAGYQRRQVDSLSYAFFLRNFKLKKHNTKVQYFNGSFKERSNVYCAVLDIDCGTKDLQQCADAVMRLRGEYLYQQKRYDEIHFNFLKDKKPHYFLEYSNRKTDYPTFRKYMDYVFSYANTGSLADEMHPKRMQDLQAGDVLIQKKTPYGHAVTVMDVAYGEKGEIAYLLSQSYMPAQDIQVLLNPSEPDFSPWYKVDGKFDIKTPEWNFTTSDLKTFVKP